MAKKKKKKKKLRGAALAAWRKSHGLTPKRKKKSGKKKSGSKKGRTRKACPYCGHHAHHHRTAGCLHRDASTGRFCSCKAR